MKYQVNIPNINLDFTVPPSKSVVHRQLIISFLLQTLSKKQDKAVINEIIEPLPTDNDDIRATRGCLKALYEAPVAEAKKGAGAAHVVYKLLNSKLKENRTVTSGRFFFGFNW